MSGVLGIWHRDGRPVEREMLAAANERLSHRGRDYTGLWIDGAAGLASQLNRVMPESSEEIQPAIGASGAVIVFDGRLDNRDKLLRLTNVPAGTPDSALVLALYDRVGVRCVAHLNGDFAFALFDPTHQRLFLARDALGVRPVYYAVAGSTVVCASEIKAILATGIVAARPNDTLLADYLFRRSQLQGDGGETFFDGILAVPPGHTVIVTRERVTVERYWSFDLGRRLPYRTFAEYADAFGVLFTQAVRRRLRSATPVAVAVSGGLDSSGIFCFAHSIAPNGVRGFSSMGVPGSPADESSYIEALEQALGVEIDRFRGPPARLIDDVQDEVAQVEAPILDLQWRRSHAFRRHVRDSGARVLLTGHWGDQVLFDQSYVVDLVARLQWGQAWRHLREFPRWFTDSPAWEFYRSAAVDVVKRYVPGGRRLVSAVRRATGAGGDPPWYDLALSNGGRVERGDPRWRDRSYAAHSRSVLQEATNKFHTLYLELNNKVAALAGLDVAFPFLDRDLVSFLIAVPGEIASHDGVPKALLRAAGQGVLPAETAARRWKADFTTLVNAGVKDDLETVRRLLGQESLAVRRGYVSRTAMDRHFTQAAGGLDGDTALFAWAVRDVVGLESWLQTFCRDDSLVGG